MNKKYTRYSFDYDEEGRLIIKLDQAVIICRIYLEQIVGKTKNQITNDIIQVCHKTAREKTKGM